MNDLPFPLNPLAHLRRGDDQPAPIGPSRLAAADAHPHAGAQICNDGATGLPQATTPEQVIVHVFVLFMTGFLVGRFVR